MSPHWRLAIVYAAFVLGLSALAGAVTLYFYGAAYATALLYGIIIGLISFVSTALTASLMTGSSTAAGMTVGGISFIARLGFAAAALGVPAYLDLWPTVTMLVAFASVYAAENILLIPVLLSKRSRIDQAEHIGDHRMERRLRV